MCQTTINQRSIVIKAFAASFSVESAMKAFVFLLQVAFAISLSVNQSFAQVDGVEPRWISADRLTRRTCPATSCGSVGWLALGQQVEVFEVRDGWAKITRPYTASCVEGVSEYVEEGNARCEPENGIVNGEFSEWVSITYLTDSRPADPAETASDGESLVAKSDDFGQHRDRFVEAANELIASGRCSENDFRESGGWAASTTEGRDVYFTYCGGFNLSNRIYLNVSNGNIFQ